MSIINRMLQDLDRRNAIRTDDEAHTLASKVRPVSPQRGRSDTFRWAMVLGVALIAIAAGWIIWERTQRPVVAPVTQPAAVKPAPQPQSPAPPAATEAAPPAASTEAIEDRVDMLKLATKLGTSSTMVAEAIAVAKPTPPSPVPERPSQNATEPAKAPARTVVAAAPKESRNAASKSVPAGVASDAVKTSPPGKAPDARVAASKAAEVLAQAAKTQPSEPRIDKSSPQSARERAEREYQRALGLINQGRMAEGIELLQGAVALDGSLEPARQTLIALLIESKRYEEAARMLSESLALRPSNIGAAMLLARLHVERKDLANALTVLETHSAAGARNPEYHAFRAALYQRMNRHRDAVEEYEHALALAPANGAWWMGRALSLQALDRPKDALESFRRARQSGNLNADLVAFVDQRIRQLQ